MNRSLKQLIAALGIAASTSVMAVPVTVDIVDDGKDVFFRHGTDNNGGTIVDINGSLPAAGEFQTIINGIEGLFTFCLEVDQELNTDPLVMDMVAVSIGPNFTSQAQINRLNRLYANFYDDAILNADNAAAFQLGLWEVQKDGANPVSFEDGDFKLDLTSAYAGDINARDIAVGWLATVNNGSPQLPNGWELLELRHSDWQDLIIIRDRVPPDPPGETPEPGSLALLGLGALAFARYRKRA